MAIVFALSTETSTLRAPPCKKLSKRRSNILGLADLFIHSGHGLYKRQEREGELVEAEGNWWGGGCR